VGAGSFQHFQLGNVGASVSVLGSLRVRLTKSVA
jgi:hypothetical protein